MSGIKLTFQIITLHPRNVFRISRADESEVRNVIVKVEQGGVIAYGEASPNPFYRETADEVLQRLAAARSCLLTESVNSPSDIERIWTEAWHFVQPSRAAQCALDVALWDLLGRTRGLSVTELALGAKPHPVQSCCTIGLSRPEELEEKVRELAHNPMIKVKMNRDVDLGTVRYIRSRTKAALAVDANGAWGDVDIGLVSRELADLGAVFIEQPLPPAQTHRMPGVLAQSVLPIIADESCVLGEDVAAMPGNFSGFNIKLVKCGGLTPALKMLREGKSLGLKTMVGCMLESSVLIAAGAVVGQTADYADLDGAWLLRDDPFGGLRFEAGILSLPDQPGLGVHPK